MTADRSWWKVNGGLFIHVFFKSPRWLTLLWWCDLRGRWTWQPSSSWNFNETLRGRKSVPSIYTGGPPHNHAWRISNVFFGETKHLRSRLVDSSQNSNLTVMFVTVMKKKPEPWLCFFSVSLSSSLHRVTETSVAVSPLFFPHLEFIWHVTVHVNAVLQPIC